MTSDNIFIVHLDDDEIDTVRRAGQLIGKTLTNVLHDFVIEQAERTIEDAEMCQEMAVAESVYYDDDRSEKDCLWDRSYLL